MILNSFSFELNQERLEAQKNKEYVKAEDNLAKIQEIREQAEGLLIKDLNKKGEQFLEEIDEQTRVVF